MWINKIKLISLQISPNATKDLQPRMRLHTPLSLGLSSTELAPNNNFSFTWNGKEDQVSHKAQQVRETMNNE